MVFGGFALACSLCCLAQLFVIIELYNQLLHHCLGFGSTSERARQSLETQKLQLAKFPRCPGFRDAPEFGPNGLASDMTETSSRPLQGRVYTNPV